MLAKKFIIILILVSILFAWAGDQILLAFSSKECGKCCSFDCQCCRSIKESCEKKAQIRKSSCDYAYKVLEKVQATLPNNIKADYKGYRENQAAKFAVMPPDIKLTLASFGYYLEYMGNTLNSLIYTECRKYRAPPA